MDNYSSGGIGAAAVVLVGVIYKLFHHFKCTSKCCGLESSLKVDLDTPPTNGSPLKINIPDKGNA